MLIFCITGIVKIANERSDIFSHRHSNLHHYAALSIIIINFNLRMILSQSQRFSLNLYNYVPGCDLKLIEANSNFRFICGVL